MANAATLHAIDTRIVSSHIDGASEITERSPVTRSLMLDCTRAMSGSAAAATHSVQLDSGAASVNWSRGTFTAAVIADPAPTTNRRTGAARAAASDSVP